ncbi:dienelactone hydrolase family protein [Thioalkalivibrio sp. ALE20]|uniref:dienelactone hydrolase family protein n=1 Tax=Thioalkalivibrio sp. ALE20 TaxID=545275 RepID=UPI00037C0F21|nr:dienelactone hydrolase family protein [Thioalkalivibrio sp. ALE20]
MQPLRTLSAAVALAALFPGLALADLHTESVTYEHDGQTFEGFIAWDPSVDGPRPGVLVVHEWWGHNDYARSRAEQLAAEGYTAFSLDMYGDGRTADHPSEAGEFAGQVRENRDMMLERFGAAHDYLRGHDQTADQPVAAVGYCFGGTVALEAARAGADLALVASFHGALATEHPASADTLKPEVLVFNGAADPMVPKEQVDAFREEMDNADADWTLVDFGGVLHSFTNPDADSIAERFDMPVGYDERADRDSWQYLLGALERRLK